MKFGRLLRTISMEAGQGSDLFAAYKGLKKEIKKLPSKEQLEAQGADAAAHAETQFVAALSATLHQLNEIFIEKEEHSVIRVERLEHQLAGGPASPAQLAELHKAFVDFHGEVLLLVHWSILAYTATVKILKKHHKRTGLLVQAPQLGNLLGQPFCSTEMMTTIARRVEEDIARLSERMGVATPRLSEPSQQLQQRLGSSTAEPGAATPTAAAAAAVAAAAAGGSDPAAAAAAAAAAATAAVTGSGGTGCSAAAVAAVAAAAMAAARQGLDLLPDVGLDGLDMQLLRQLAAASESGTSRSDGDNTAEQDTCASRQQHDLRSQQARVQQHAADDGEHPEVQSGPKRRRVEQPAATGVQDEAAAAAAERGAPEAAAAAEMPQDQQGGEEAAEATGEAPGAQQQQPADSSLIGSAQQQTDGQQHQEEAAAGCDAATGAAADGDAAADCAAADCSAAGGHASCAHEASILRQTQVALTTWRHLQSTASTPSTVMQGSVPRYPANNEGALTASSAVQ